jgi:hypothetical protein
MKALAAVALFALIASVASAQSKHADPTVFGFNLGGSLSLPECSTSAVGANRFYKHSDGVVCFERSDENAEAPLINERITIRFPFDKQPPLVSGTGISACVVDGTLESVSFSTAGMYDQDRVLAELKNKYGVPSTISETKMQNAMGAVFASHYAVWRFLNLSVSFRGTTARIDDGLVTIETKKGAEFRSASLRVLQPAGPKL